MSVVLDTSVVITWLLDEQATRETWSALAHVQNHGARAPLLLKYETANVVTRAVRAERLSAGEASAFFGVLEDLPIRYDADGGGAVFDAVALLAIDLSLSAYDATFLELALRTGAPLATRDKALARAAQTLGTALFF